MFAAAVFKFKRSDAVINHLLTRPMPRIAKNLHRNVKLTRGRDA